MFRLPLLVVAVLLAGCLARSADIPPNFDLQGWIGRPVADVIATWGAPTRIAEGPAGRTFTWVATQYGERSLPANRVPSGGPDDRGVLENLRCRAVFATGPDGVVTGAEWRGGECWGRPE